VFRRILAVGFIFWVYCAFFSSDYDYDYDYDYTNDNDYVYVEGGSPSLMPLSAPRQANLTPKQQSDLVFAMSEDECMKDLIPWKGPHVISTTVRNIKLSVGKGNIFTNVVVRSSITVGEPTLVIKANVTKNLPERDDDEDDDDDDNDDDNDDNREKDGPKGLHFELKDEEDSLEVVFWADSNLDEPAPEEPEDPEYPDDPPTDPVPPPPHHRHRHGRKHHKKHHKKHHDKKHHGWKHHRKHHERKHRHDQDESFWMKKRSFRDEASRGQKFCASIDVEILLPIAYNSLDHLSINGVVLRATVTDDLAPIFGEGIDNLEINAVVGEIKTGPVRTNTLTANVVAGTIDIENVQAATFGTAIHARVSSVAANITLGVSTTSIDKPEEDDGDEDDGGEESAMGCKEKKSIRGRFFGGHGGDGDDDGDDDDDDEPEPEPAPRRRGHHLVMAKATAGAINVRVTEAEDDLRSKTKRISRIDGEQVPGILVVRTGTGGGDIHTHIDLVKGRQLNLRSESFSGKIVSHVSDKFLGSFKVSSLLGAAEIEELEGSPSTIDYSKNQKNAKVGRKIIVRDGDDDDGDDDNSVLGDIVLGSPISGASLKFF